MSELSERPRSVSDTPGYVESEGELLHDFRDGEDQEEGEDEEVKDASEAPNKWREWGMDNYAEKNKEGVYEFI